MADLADVTILACALPDPPADECPTAGRDGAATGGAAGSDVPDQRTPDQRTPRELRRELALRALI